MAQPSTGLPAGAPHRANGSSPAGFAYRVGFLGCPPQPEVEWSEANIARLKELGFNTLQLNIAWGYRPGGEALNLEDVIDVAAPRRGGADAR